MGRGERTSRGSAEAFRGRGGGSGPLNQNHPLPPSPVPGRNLGRGRPPGPRFQSLARSHKIRGAGDKPAEERRLLPQRRHRGGASSVGRGLRVSPLEEHPSPPLAPACTGADERRCAPLQPQWKLTSAGRRIQKKTLVSPHLRKELEGKGRKP